MKSIVLGGGCFWCLEASYQLIKGVNKVIPGYAGGSFNNPNYYNIQDHAEVVLVEYDETIVSLSDILDIFWIIHDPTTLNRQGADIGPHYRSIILYVSDNEKDEIEKSKAKSQELWNDKIVTEIKKLDKFYEAEPEHHDFFKKNPKQAYCQIVINPKLQKVTSKFQRMLK
jgi:peptide-methionine (S)-S-oxide reductase